VSSEYFPHEPFDPVALHRRRADFLGHGDPEARQAIRFGRVSEHEDDEVGRVHAVAVGLDPPELPTPA
jgi:hypothetical protein